MIPEIPEKNLKRHIRWQWLLVAKKHVAGICVRRLEELHDEVLDELHPVLYVMYHINSWQRANHPPLYEVQMWNYYDATRKNEHHTNNLSQGYHNHL